MATFDITKSPEEIITIPIQYDSLDDGNPWVISSVDINAQEEDGDPFPSLIDENSIAWDDDQVQFKVRGGVDGKTYKVTSLATMTTGDKREASGYIRVASF